VPSCIVRHQDRWLMYYIGFQRAERVPYMLFTGLAESLDGIQFRRVQKTPVLDRTASEPFSRGAPFVMKERDRFVCYYWSCWGWTTTHGSLHYNNHIRRISSDDPLNWDDSHSDIVLECSQTDEFSVGRPWILVVDGVYHMWLSSRSSVRPYRLGYAISRDGHKWHRHDEVLGIAPSATGWDSDMVCYSSLVEMGDKVLMLYNGNGHGRSGFGVAELEGGIDSLRAIARELLP
jgi:hypothetical protein